MRKLRLLTLLASLGLCAQTGVLKTNPLANPGDIDHGARLFTANCALCHGPKGTGGRGADLARPRLTRAIDDTAMFQIIHDGIPGTEMPANRAMTDHEMWQVIAYVRTLGRAAAEKVSGDPASGAAVFRAKGCMGCHAIGAAGGNMGPSLAEAGERRSAAYLRAALLDPTANLPDGFTMAEITTTMGNHVTGIVLNEDTYSIQMRDLAGNLHSFWKAELTALEEHDDRTPMPSFRGRLSDRELNDLVAYLVSLRGIQ
jgi:cytochrome c oxidase cbb3-type subunit III